MKRTEILKKANECVCGDREQDYGSPESNFQLIADLWSTYIGTDISAVDVAMMMAMLKIARVKSGRYHEDNFIDLAGYAACAGEIAGANEEPASEMPCGVADDIVDEILGLIANDKRDLAIKKSNEVIAKLAMEMLAKRSNK